METTGILLSKFNIWIKGFYFLEEIGVFYYFIQLLIQQNSSHLFLFSSIIIIDATFILNQFILFWVNKSQYPGKTNGNPQKLNIIRYLYSS